MQCVSLWHAVATRTRARRVALVTVVSLAHAICRQRLADQVQITAQMIASVSRDTDNIYGKNVQREKETSDEYEPAKRFVIFLKFSEL